MSSTKIFWLGKPKVFYFYIYFKLSVNHFGGKMISVISEFKIAKNNEKKKQLISPDPQKYIRHPDRKSINSYPAYNHQVINYHNSFFFFAYTFITSKEVNLAGTKTTSISVVIQYGFHHSESNFLKTNKNIVYYQPRCKRKKLDKNKTIISM